MQDDFAAAFAGADEGAADAAPHLLARMDAEIDKLLKLEAWILETEESLKAAKAAALAIKQKSLPDMMAELRFGGEIERNGFKLRMADFVSGSLPNRDEKPAEHRQAIEYLKTLPGGADLLRTSVSVDFGKGQENIAQSFIQDAIDFYKIEPTVKYGVPHQTLQAYARQRLEAAEEINTDILGLYCGRAVKVTPVKEKKSK